MAVTRESICNLMLLRLGHSQRIADLAAEAATDEVAAQLLAVFDSVRDRVQEDFPWGFARDFVQLATPTTGDVTVHPWALKWRYRYLYPAGCLVVRRFITEAGSRGVRPPPMEIGYSASGKVVYTDVPETEAQAEISRHVTDPALFDASYESAFSWGLGSDFAVALTGDMDRRKECQQQYLVAVAARQRADVTERVPERDVAGDIEGSRW